MKIRPLESTLRLSTIPLLLSALAGCNDERLRELGYTLDNLGAPFDDDSETAPESPCVPDAIDADTVQRSVAADLAAAARESRPFLRYFSLADQVARGSCSDQLEWGRDAASKLVNSLSREPNIVVPLAFGPEQSLLRIDLRDYGFTRPLDVDGESFADGWEALIARTSFALELTGEDASFIAEQTHTRAPVLSVSAFVSAAAEASLYYAFLAVPPTLGELRQLVGLPSVLDPLDDGATRTAAQYSRIVRQTGGVRVIDRYPIATGTAGTYHEATMVDAGTFFADPLHVQESAQRLISFSLPNDLMGFAVTDAAGVRQGVPDRVLDTNMEDARARVPISCGNCHANGRIPATDFARDAVLDHPAQFSPEVVAAYQASLNEDQRYAQFAADSAPYLKALEQSTGESQGGDPISSVWFSSDQEVDLARAAAELLVSPDVLGSRLDELAPELIPLGLGLGLAPAQFSGAYAAAYCVLHADDDNPPAPAFCAPEP